MSWNVSGGARRNDVDTWKQTRKQHSDALGTYMTPEREAAWRRIAELAALDAEIAKRGRQSVNLQGLMGVDRFQRS